MKKSHQPVFFLVLCLGSLYLTTGFAWAKWERLFGGPGNDIGQSVKQTTDSGYIIAGYTATFTSEEIVFQDNFDDEILDPTWAVSFEYADGWTYTESGTELEVTDINSTINGGYQIFPLDKWSYYTDTVLGKTIITRGTIKKSSFAAKF